MNLARPGRASVIGGMPWKGCVDSTPMARSRPARMCSITGPEAMKPMSTCPPCSAAIAGPSPSKGTLVTGKRVWLLNMAVRVKGTEPVPAM